MNRLRRRTLIVAVLFTLAGAIFTLSYWLVATSSGSRWVLRTALPWAGINVSAKKIDGRLIGHLHLTKAQISLPQQKIEIDSVDLHWQPLLLLTGKMTVRGLAISGVRFQNDSPSDHTPPDLSWPQLLPFAYLFTGKIAHLDLKDVSYREQQNPPVKMTSITASAIWKDGRLSITNLAALFPSGRISGTISAGFKPASLTAKLAVSPSLPIAGMDHFSFQLQQTRAEVLEQFAATLSITGSSGNRKLLELAGDVGMTSAGFNLHRLNLTRPGQKGMAAAKGSLLFTNTEPVLSLNVKLVDLDLTSELSVPTKLSGSLNVSGTLDKYQGNLSLTNQVQGWQATAVSASYQGTAEGLHLTSLAGTALDGTLDGELNIDWRNGFALNGKIRGRKLNPARIAPDWEGAVSFDAAGQVEWPGNAPMRGAFRVSLPESRLHGQALTGEMQVDLADNTLSHIRLALQGKGFDLQVSGEMSQRFNLTARVGDLSRLAPGASGSLKAEGWMRYSGPDSIVGSLSCEGSRLVYLGTQIGSADLSVRSDQGAGPPLHITASLQNVTHGKYLLNAVTVKASGSLPNHTVNISLAAPRATVQLDLEAGYKNGAWKGEINRLSGKDKIGPWNIAAPSSFSIGAGKVLLSPLSITGAASERLEVAADISMNPLIGQLRGKWNDLNLSRAAPYLVDRQISGRSDGSVTLGFLSKRRLTLTGKVGASGTYIEQGHALTLRQGTLTAHGGEQGLRADLKLDTADGGSLLGTYYSTAPLHLALPEKGELTMNLSRIDLVLLKPWLPSNTRLEGRISSRAKGVLHPGHGFEFDGKAELSKGIFHRQGPSGSLNIAFKSATASWKWHQETLSGTLSLVMEKYGHAQADFQLPLAARFPPTVISKGPLRTIFSGKFQEKGILTSLFPDFVQESSGEIDTELAVNGTWNAPRISGKLQLAKAGAYLPATGIHVKNVQFTANLEKNHIKIQGFRADSGDGNIEGNALLNLAGGQVVSYQGAIDGKNFQTVDFPEVRILSTPKLTFSGTPQKLSLRGELLLPELSVASTPSRKMITPSSDVVLEGKASPTAAASAFDLDIQVRVRLGDRAFVKIEGIDAQVGGAVDLSLHSLDRITSTGEITVVKGRYRSYGVNLDIVRGRLFFAGSKFDNPTLDFLALRTIGNIQAGVTVTGTLQQPITKLYSNPSMQDGDTLAYIVLGHPLGGSGEQASLLTQAAGALLTSDKARDLKEQVKNRLGLSTLEIQGGVGGTTDYMGYKPLQITPPGEIPAAQQPGITQTMLTVGKFLTPQLYISYGRSLFTDSNLFRLRYDIFQKWQIETQTGSNESGADLYYKMEFK